MPEENIHNQPVESRPQNIQPTNGTHRIRRRSKKKHKSSIKKYFEWLIWGMVIAAFIYVVYSLIKASGFKDKNLEKQKTALLEITGAPASSQSFYYPA